MAYSNPTSFYPGFPGKTQEDRLAFYKKVDGLCLMLEEGGKSTTIHSKAYKYGNIEEHNGAKKCVSLQPIYRAGLDSSLLRKSENYLDVWVPDSLKVTFPSSKDLRWDGSHKVCQVADGKYGVEEKGSNVFSDFCTTWEDELSFTKKRFYTRIPTADVTNPLHRTQYTLPDSRDVVSFIDGDLRSITTGLGQAAITFDEDFPASFVDGLPKFNRFVFRTTGSTLPQKVENDYQLKACRITNPEFVNYQAIGQVEINADTNSPTCITPFILGKSDRDIITEYDFETFVVPLSWNINFRVSQKGNESVSSNQLSAAIKQFRFINHQPWVNTAVSPLTADFTLRRPGLIKSIKVSNDSNRGIGNKYVCIADNDYPPMEGSRYNRYSYFIGVTIFNEASNQLTCMGPEKYILSSRFVVPFFNKELYPQSINENETGQNSFVNKNQWRTVQAYIDEDLNRNDAAFARGTDPYKQDLNVKARVASTLTKIGGLEQPKQLEPGYRSVKVNASVPEAYLKNILRRYYPDLTAQEGEVIMTGKILAYIQSQLQRNIDGEDHLLKKADLGELGNESGITLDNYPELLGNMYLTIEQVSHLQNQPVGSKIEIGKSAFLMALGGLVVEPSTANNTGYRYGGTYDQTINSNEHYRYQTLSDDIYRYYRDLLDGAGNISIGANGLGLYPFATIPTTKAALATVLGHIEVYYGKDVATELINNNQYNSRKLQHAIELAFAKLMDEKNRFSTASMGIVKDKVIKGILMLDISHNMYAEMRALSNVPQTIASGLHIKPGDVCTINSELSMFDCYVNKSINTFIGEYYYYRLGVERLGITTLINVAKDPSFELPDCSIDGGDNCISFVGNGARTDTLSKIFNFAELAMEFKDFLPGLSSRSLSKFWKKRRGSAINNQVPLRKLGYKKGLGVCLKP